MRCSTLFLCLVLGVVSVAAQAADSSTVAVVGVSIIPMDRERVLTDQTLIVREGKITELGSTSDIKPPADAQTIDARGKYVLPGLAEMHGHLVGGDTALNERILLLSVLHGVTTFRVMQGHPSHLALRERVQRGELLGPRLYVAAPQLSGNSAPTPESAIPQVKEAKKQGFDLLKIQEGLSRPTFDAIAQTADKLGIPFAGHVPADVGLQRALEARFRTIDHLDGYVEALIKPGANVDLANAGLFGAALIEHVDVSKIPELVRATKKAGTAIVPTDTVAWNFLSTEPIEKLFARPEFKYLPKSMVEGWEKLKRGTMQQTKMSDVQRDRYFSVRRKLIKALHDGGVPMLLGSDAPQVLNVPGASIAVELELMVAAGLTPYQALAMGTRNVAMHFGTSRETGTVEKGKRTDLLVLDANPLENVGNTRERFGVFVNGKWLSRAEIDKKLSGLAAL